MSVTGGEQVGSGSRLGARLTVIGLVAFFLFALAGVVRGAYFAHPEIHVSWVDAGPESEYAIGRVVPLAGQGVYVLGMEDGSLRAVDGLVKGSGCWVEYLPDDERGLAHNPRRQPGAFRDPCTGTVWAANADAIEGTREPLRTFSVASFLAPDGSRHVRVEVLGDRSQAPR
jgi:hypothetical protein